MPIKDPEKRRIYHRNWRRAKVQGLRKIIEPVEKLETVSDLRRVLETVVSQIMHDKSMDLAVKGRVVAQLLTVGVKIIEFSDIERRIIKIEEALTKQK